MTAGYLAVIEIDDGLEALAFLPIIGFLSFVPAMLAGWLRAQLFWPMLAAMTASVTSAAIVFVIVPETSSSGLSLAEAVFVGSAFFAVPGGYTGYGLGRIARWRFQTFARRQP